MKNVGEKFEGLKGGREFRVLACADTGARTPLGVRQYFYMEKIHENCSIFGVFLFHFLTTHGSLLNKSLNILLMCSKLLMHIVP
jgi:hypothetical protein